MAERCTWVDPLRKLADAADELRRQANVAREFYGLSAQDMAARTGMPREVFELSEHLVVGKSRVGDRI